MHGADVMAVFFADRLEAVVVVFAADVVNGDADNVAVVDVVEFFDPLVGGQFRVGDPEGLPEKLEGELI